MPDRKTVTVQRANAILQVPEEWVDRYLDQGYDIIDAHGNVIKASMPKDLGTLQKAYVDHIKEIEELKQQVEELKQRKTGRSKKQ